MLSLLAYETFSAFPEALNLSRLPFSVQSYKVVCQSTCSPVILKSAAFYFTLGAGPDSMDLVIPDISFAQQRITVVDESYQIRTDGTQYHITAGSQFGIVRAFRTIALSNSHQSHSITVSDQPKYKLRAYRTDVQKFVHLSTLRNLLDSLSIQQFNILILKLHSELHFPLHFDGTSYSDGAFSPTHYYDAADLEELSEYAQSRGVVIIPEFTPLVGAGPLRRSDYTLVADCPLQKRQPEKILLIVASDLSLTVWADIINRTMRALFTHGTISPIISLGGERFPFDCWAQDDIVRKRIFRMDGGYQEASDRFYSDLIGQLGGIQLILNQDIQHLGTNSTIVDFTHQHTSGVVNSPFPVIQSFQFRLDLMSPNGKLFYAFSDSYKGFQSIDISNTIGAVAGMPTQMCWGEGCHQQAFSRGIAISDMLWGTKVGGHVALQNTCCFMRARGLQCGPLESGPPCL